MRELPTDSRIVQTEEHLTLKLKYAILVEETPSGLESYGVIVTAAEPPASVSVPGLTMNAQKIYDLVETLARCTVTPTSLMDVLADWL